jgi:hypothetical protein
MAQGENLQQNDTYVSELAEALRSQVSLSAVPGLLKQVIKNDMWRRRIVRQTKKAIEYNRFADFVKDYPPDGLGSNMNVLMSLCRFHEDIEAVDLLSKVDAGKEGNPTGNNQYTSGTVDIINSSTRTDRPTGTSAAATMRRLSKDFPLIHERVLSGELSPNKAALEAGFRQPKFQLPADPIAAGRYMANRVDKDWMLEFYDAYTKAQGE